MTYELGELSTLKRQWLFRNSNIPRRFMGLEPSDISKTTGVFPAVVTDWLQEAYEGKRIKGVGGLGRNGVGLLFDGKPGLGKTTHAVVTAMEFVRNMPEDEAHKILAVAPGESLMSMRPIYYLTYPEFLSRKKGLMDANDDVKGNLYREMEGFHGRAKEDHLNVRLLILDDLGKEYGSSYNDSSFDEILRSRYDKALPTIVTTNVRMENWDTQYSEAMHSFAHEAFRRVVLVGKDLRQG
jgi:DNA replication protein DnaC